MINDDVDDGDNTKYALKTYGVVILLCLSVPQSSGGLHASHRGGGHVGDGGQTGPHVCVHIRPVSLQPPQDL